MECSGCSQPLPPENDFVSCRGCEKSFDYVCAGVRESNWRKYNAETKFSWRCVICKAKNTGDNAKYAVGNSPPRRVEGGVKSKNDANTNQVNRSKAVDKFDEIDYLKELLKQKDIIIDSQADLINSLKEQILLLKRNIGFATTSPTLNPIPVSSATNAATHAAHRKQQSSSAPARKTDGSSGQLVNEEGAKVGVTNLDVHEAIAKAKLNNIVNLTSDTEDKVQNEWKTVGSRRRKKTIVGEKPNDSACKLRAVEALSHWHVYRLHPDTRTEDVTNYLRNDFPEVLVESLKSANPEVYSSFKVTVPQRDGPRILDVALWPSGTRVNRFFLPKNR